MGQRRGGLLDGLPLPGLHLLDGRALLLAGRKNHACPLSDLSLFIRIWDAAVSRLSNAHDVVGGRPEGVLD